MCRYRCRLMSAFPLGPIIKGDGRAVKVTGAPSIGCTGDDILVTAGAHLVDVVVTRTSFGDTGSRT